MKLLFNCKTLSIHSKSFKLNLNLLKRFSINISEKVNKTRDIDSNLEDIIDCDILTIKSLKDKDFQRKEVIGFQYLINNRFNVLYFNNEDLDQLNISLSIIIDNVKKLNQHKDLEQAMILLERELYKLLYMNFKDKTNHICLVTESTTHIKYKRYLLLMNISQLVENLLKYNITSLLISRIMQHLIDQIILIQDLSVKDSNIYLNENLVIYVLENADYDVAYKNSIFNRLLANLKYLKFTDFLEFLSYIDRKRITDSNFSIYLSPFNRGNIMKYLEYYINKRSNYYDNFSTVLSLINNIHNTELRETLFEYFLDKILSYKKAVYFKNMLIILKSLYESGMKLDKIYPIIDLYEKKIENYLSPNFRRRQLILDINHFNDLIDNLVLYGKFIANKKFFDSLNEFLIYCADQNPEVQKELLNIFEKLLDNELVFINPSNLITIYEERIVSRTMTLKNTVSVLKILIYSPNYLCSELLKNFLFSLNEEMRNMYYNKPNDNYVVTIIESQNIEGIIELLFYLLYFDYTKSINMDNTYKILNKIIQIFKKKSSIVDQICDGELEDLYDFTLIKLETCRIILNICSYYKLFLDKNRHSSILNENFDKFCYKLKEYYYLHNIPLIHRFNQQRQKITQEIITILKESDETNFTIHQDYMLIDLIKYDLFIQTNNNLEKGKKNSFLFSFQFSIAESLHSLPEKISLKYQDLCLETLGVKHILLDYTLWITKSKDEKRDIIFSLIK